MTDVRSAEKMVEEFWERWVVGLDALKWDDLKDWLANWEQGIRAAERERACAILTPPPGQTVIMPINEFCENARRMILAPDQEAPDA